VAVISPPAVIDPEDVTDALDKAPVTLRVFGSKAPRTVVVFVTADMTIPSDERPRRTKPDDAPVPASITYNT
jgi:hypothetical protein